MLPLLDLTPRCGTTFRSALWRRPSDIERCSVIPGDHVDVTVPGDGAQPGAPVRPPLAAVLFDFDGTLWDCEPLIFQAYNEYFRQHGHWMPRALWRRLIGTVGVAPWPYLEQLTGRPVDHAAADAAVLRRKLALLAGGRPVRGVRRFLGEIDEMGLRRGIVSNSSRDWIAKYAGQCGLDRGWHLIECADGDRDRAKPNPDLYLSALARLELAADQVVAFEDSPSGVRAATRAGIRCVAVRGPLTVEADLGGADACIRDFDSEARTLLPALGFPVAPGGRR